MYTKILVALDGTEFSESILAQVEELAGKGDAEIMLFTVLPHPQMHIENGRVFATVDQEMERVKVEAERYLGQLEQRFCDKGIRTTRATSFGDPAREIADFARRNQVDLIAMATHGRQGLDRFLHGSVSEAVLRQASTPMLVLKAA